MTTSISVSQAPHPRWQPATWADYERYRDDPNTPKHLRLFFQNGFLWVNAMGWEGIEHAKVRDLFVMLLAFWFVQHPEQEATSLGGCLLEKEGMRAAAPDLVLYLGADAPIWREGESRRVDLNDWRVPDLVGEVADTTLPIDLDEMKQIYAALGVPEYWVIDVQGRRVLAFLLQAGQYQPCETSIALQGLPIALLEQSLKRMADGSNITAASWFAGAIGKF
jgi:Uma2 family endonuclease